MKQSDKEIFVNQESAQHPKKNESLSSSSTFRSVVKVDSDRIDNVLDAVGELVVIKSQLMNEIQVSSMHHSKLSDIVSLLDRTIRELQDKALSMRMTPIKSIFLKAQRIVRDLSLKLNKEVKFDMQGEDVELDRVMVETISDPLMHLLRNCLDHGIEDHEERLKKKKNPVGLIQLKAQAIGSRIIIQIKDDGGGIKREKIIIKAVKKGFIKSSAEAHSLSDNEIFQFIFKPGFSTAECVTDVSGRGVGMDVVKTNIDKVRGSIQIESSIDLGTLFTLSLPLTSSITEGLLINVNKHPYIISLDNVVELIDENQFQSTTLPTGEKVLCLRDKFFPVIDLRKIYYKKNIGSLQLSRSADNSLEEFQSSIDELKERPSSVILVESQGVVFAIMMNEVLGQTQVVQKTISNYINVNQTCLSGAAILGNGRVALVIDIEELLKTEILRIYSKNSLQKISTQSNLINKKG